MSKVDFFKHIDALLADKESIELKAVKVGGELTLLVIPKIAGKTATLTITGSAEDLDAGFMDELNKPIAKIYGLISNANAAEIKDAEEEEDDNDPPANSDAYVDKQRAKKAAPAKSTAKKKLETSVKKDKAAAAKKEPKEEESDSDQEEESDSDVDAKLTAEREAEEAVAKQKVEEEAAEQKRQDEEAQKVLDNMIAIKIKAMELGAKYFNERKYEESEACYMYAGELFPHDELIKQLTEKTSKWVDRLIDGEIISGRTLNHEDIRKEVKDGIESK